MLIGAPLTSNMRPSRSWPVSGRACRNLEIHLRSRCPPTSPWTAILPHYPARVIHNADAGLLDRYVQSSKMVHAALLLLMLEAVTTDLVFTISLKRSTQNLQLSTSWAGRLHHLYLATFGSRRAHSIISSERTNEVGRLPID